MFLMKFLLAITLASCVFLVGCRNDAPTNDAANPNPPTVVDAACGQCLLDLKDKKGCDLAVRLGDKSYFVDGFAMNELGDAHADDGMCNTVRKAKVTGEIVNDRFVASCFELLPVE